MAQTKRAAARAEKPDNDQRRFKCTTCERSFKRSEHCARHELMHTEVRPFGCRYCSKRYGRKDLLRRHERTLHVAAYTEEASQSLIRHSPDSRSVTNPDDEANNLESPRDPTIPDHELSGNPRSQTAGDGQEQTHQASLEGNMPGGLSPSSLMQGAGFFDAPQLAGHSFLPLAGSDPLLLQLLMGGTPEAGVNVATPEQSIHERRDAATRVASCAPPGQEQDDETSQQQRITGSVSLTHPTRHDCEPDNSPPGIWHSPGAGPGLDIFDLHSLNLQMDLGHSPVDGWSRNPNNLTQQLPVILQEQPAPSPKSIFDWAGFEWLHNDACVRLGISGSRIIHMKEIQEFTNSYINSFHQHLPFIHLPSFSLVKSFHTPSPLALAMASIGALYRLKRRRAHGLYELTEKMISSMSCQGPDAPTRTPLWFLQTKILLAFFAIFSSKESLASNMFDRMGFMMLEYQWRRIEVQHQANNRRNMSWREWVNYETTKRSLCAMFIFSNLMLTTFNLTPGFVIDRDLLIEMPDHEELWCAKTEDTWLVLRQTLLDTPSHTMQSILECMIQPPVTESPAREAYHISGFTALVVIHAVNIYLWHLNQLAQSVSRFSLGIWPHDNLRGALLQAAASTLERCDAALQTGRPKDDDSARDDPEHMLLFNCEAFLRVAITRLVPPSHSFNRLALLTDDRAVIMRAVKAYARERLDRNAFVTKAARKAYEGFLEPVTIGALLVSKTAALSWSLEQAVAGWDSALLLTKWTSSLEIDGPERPPDNEELQILEDVKHLLEELDLDCVESSQRVSLAAMLARAWAPLLDDVWVWGITARMGAILRLLAVEYQEQLESITS